MEEVDQEALHRARLVKQDLDRELILKAFVEENEKVKLAKEGGDSTELEQVKGPQLEGPMWNSDDGSHQCLV